jgi:hypothetical protein
MAMRAVCNDCGWNGEPSEAQRHEVSHWVAAAMELTWSDPEVQAKVDDLLRRQRRGR